MRLGKGLFLGFLVLALGVAAPGEGQLTSMDRPEYDPQTRLYGYPGLGINPQFSHALPFSEEGLARVIVGCRYASCKETSPGYNEGRKRVWAFIDKSFNKERGTYDIFDGSNYAIYNEQFTFASSFSEDYPGFAKVRLKNDPNTYYINVEGEIRFGQTEDGRLVVEPTDELMEFLRNEYRPPRQ